MSADPRPSNSSSLTEAESTKLVSAPPQHTESPQTSELLDELEGGGHTGDQDAVRTASSPHEHSAELVQEIDNAVLPDESIPQAASSSSSTALSNSSTTSAPASAAVSRPSSSISDTSASSSSASSSSSSSSSASSAKAPFTESHVPACASSPKIDRRHQVQFLNTLKEQFEKVLDMRDRLFDSYFDPEYQELLGCFREEELLQSVEKHAMQSSLSERFLELRRAQAGQQPIASPFETIVENCKREAGTLHSSSVQITVYGRTKVGKSTLCNAILGQELFHTSNMQCTAVKCVACSGQLGENGKPVARVIMEPDVDVNALLELRESEYEDLAGDEAWEKFKVLIRRVANSEDGLLADVATEFPILSKLPKELRNDRLISEIRVTTPILGIERRGIGLADCPGVSEREHLDSVARWAAQRSGVLIFVMNIQTDLSKNIADVEFLARQVENGCAVFILFNRHMRDRDDEVQECLRFNLRELKAKVFKDTSPRVFTFDFEQALRACTHHGDPEKEHAFFLRELGISLRKRAEAMVFQFSNAFFQVLKAQHLLLSRLISFTVHPKLKASQESAKQTRMSALMSKKLIAEQVGQLVARANQRLQGYKKELKKLLLNHLEKEANNLRILAQNHITKEPCPDPSMSGRIRKLFQGPNTFELEIVQVLSDSFDQSFSHVYYDWMSKKRSEFIASMLEDAKPIQSETAKWHNFLASETLSAPHQQLVSDTESLILHRTQHLPMAIGGPLVGVLAGGSAAGGAMAIGVSSFLLAGGLFALGALSVAGLVVGAVSIHKIFSGAAASSELSIRNNIVDAFLEQVRKLPQNKASFAELSLRALEPCAKLRDYFESTLLMQLVEVNTLHELDEKFRLEFNKLCTFVYMRDQLADMMSRLAEKLATFESAGLRYVVNRLKSRSARGTNLERNPICTLCEQPFVHCGHLCPHCASQLDGCPQCQKWTFLMENVYKYPQEQDGVFSYLPQVEPDPSRPAAAADAVDSNDHREIVGTGLSEQAVLARKIHVYDPAFKKFADWFNETHHVHRSNLQAAIQAIDRFILGIIARMTSDVQVGFEFRRSLQQEIHRHIFPSIRVTISQLYRHHYIKEERDLEEWCAQLDRFSCRIFVQDRKFQPLDEQMAEAVAHFREIEHMILPYEILAALLRLASDIEKLNTTLTADHLTSLIVYTFARAKISLLYSTIMFVNDILYKNGDPGLQQLLPHEVYLFNTIYGVCVVLLGNATERVHFLENLLLYQRVVESQPL